MADAPSEPFGPHAILHGQDAGLEPLSLDPVRCLRRIRRHGTCLLGEGQIRVTRPIRLHHHGIAGQRRSNTELLLCPIDIGNAVARWWLDQSSQPRTRAEDEAGVARLVPAGDRSKGRQHGTVTIVMTDSQI